MQPGKLQKALHEKCLVKIYDDASTIKEIGRSRFKETFVSAGFS